MKSNDTRSEIKALTAALVSLSLSNEQNFPSTHGQPAGSFEITVKNANALTAALKNVPYQEIYEALSEANCFNMKLLDGALLCLRYRFEAGNIVEHCLTYFPSPDLEHFQNNPEIYLMDEIYADIVARNIVPVPIRFDFNAAEATLCRGSSSLFAFDPRPIRKLPNTGMLTGKSFDLRRFHSSEFL